jgi:hypothetical protein
VTVDPKLLDRYVGRYQFAPAVFLTVTRDGDPSAARTSFSISWAGISGP